MPAPRSISCQRALYPWSSPVNSQTEWSGGSTPYSNGPVYLSSTHQPWAYACTAALHFSLALKMSAMDCLRIRFMCKEARINYQTKATRHNGSTKRKLFTWIDNTEPSHDPIKLHRNEEKESLCNKCRAYLAASKAPCEGQQGHTAVAALPRM